MYNNKMRNERTRHKDGGGKKEKGQFPGGGQGEGKVMCGNEPSGAKGANFTDADSFLGYPNDNALKSVGDPKMGGSTPPSPKLKKGSKPPKKMSSNKGGGDKNTYY